MRHSLAALALVSAFVSSPAAQVLAQETPPRLSAESLLGRRTAQHAWSPDGRRLTYVWDEQGEVPEDLWILDSVTGKSEVLVLRALRLLLLDGVPPEHEPRRVRVQQARAR